MTPLANFWFRILDLLFPQYCIQCHAAGTMLCATCLTSIQLITPPICRCCGLPLATSAGTYCPQCLVQALPLHGIRATGLYQEPLRTYIHTFKYRTRPQLAEPLGLLLAYTYRTYHLQADLITSVPLYAEKQQERGYNQSQLLAKTCARILNIPCNNHLLLRRYDTSTQTHLTPQERYQNVAQAFRCKPDLAPELLIGQKILIIDDVCTTGSTLAACASPLFAAGAREVWGLVLARPNEPQRKRTNRHPS